jgi:hypothetical protein
MAEPWRRRAVIGPVRPLLPGAFQGEIAMHGIIYLVGLVVVILAVLSFFGLR